MTLKFSVAILTTRPPILTSSHPITTVTRGGPSHVLAILCLIHTSASTILQDPLTPPAFSFHLTHPSCPLFVSHLTIQLTMKQLYCTHALNLELRLRLVLQSSLALMILCLCCSVSCGWRKANSNACFDLTATNPTQAFNVEGYSSALAQSGLPPTLCTATSSASGVLLTNAGKQKRTSKVSTEHPPRMALSRSHLSHTRQHLSLQDQSRQHTKHAIFTSQFKIRKTIWLVTEVCDPSYLGHGGRTESSRPVWATW